MLAGILLIVLRFVVRNAALYAERRSAATVVDPRHPGPHLPSTL